MQPLLLEQNDLLLLTTDGLYKKIGDEQIADILRLHPRPDAAADCLIQAVRQSEGATDNTTVAVIGYDMEEQK
jgi:serine/threonine protein phosphatase PrpC